MTFGYMFSQISSKSFTNFNNMPCSSRANISDNKQFICRGAERMQCTVRSFKGYLPALPRCTYSPTLLKTYSFPKYRYRSYNRLSCKRTFYNDFWTNCNISLTLEQAEIKYKLKSISLCIDSFPPV